MSGTARGDVASRAGLERLEPGLHRSGGLLIREVKRHLWIITFDGERDPVWVRGQVEFTTLTEAAGAISDQRDLQRRAA